MSWKDDGSIEYVAGLSVCFAFFIGLVFCFYLSADFRTAPLWLILMTIVAIGVRLAERGTRAKLKELTAEAELIWKKESNERQTLEACRLRRERRAAIRAGEIKDDGLSDFGRAVAINTFLAGDIGKYESLGVSFPPTEEDIFALEELDSKIESAWKKKVAADSAWEKALAKATF